MKLIVAVDERWGIGKDGDLLLSIPDDMRFFREKTRTAVLVMGYNTLLSFPNSKPLPKRRNIVLSAEPVVIEGAEVVTSLEELFALLREVDSDNIFVIGGGSIYRQLYPYCDTAYITKMGFDGEADTFMANLDEEELWTVAEASEEKDYEGIKYRFLTYRNSAPKAL